MRGLSPTNGGALRRLCHYTCSGQQIGIHTQMRIKEAIRQVPFVAYAQGVLAIGTLMVFLVAKFRSVPQAVVGCDRS